MIAVVIISVDDNYVLVYAASRKRYYLLHRGGVLWPVIGHNLQINVPLGDPCTTVTGKKMSWFSRYTSSVSSRLGTGRKYAKSPYRLRDVLPRPDFGHGRHSHHRIWPLFMLIEFMRRTNKE